MKIYRVLLFVAVAIMAMACGTPSERINDFVANVEVECEGYTAEDWKRVDAEFERLYTDYENDFETMTEEERKTVLRAVGRYSGIRAKYGINEAFEEAKRAVEALPSLIEGFTDAFNEEE